MRPEGQAAQDFDDLLAAIATLDLERIWDSASGPERRTLIDELIDNVTVGPDWFSVTLFGSLPGRIRYGEVGLKDSDFIGVGGAYTALNPHPTRSPWFLLTIN